MPDYSRLHQDFDRRINQLDAQMKDHDKNFNDLGRKDQDHDMKLGKGKIAFF